MENTISVSGRSTTPKASALIALFVGIVLLSGCYTTSPYFTQQFPHTYSSIPIQAWTLYNTDNVNVDCVKPNAHGSPLPGESYINIATFTPGAAMLDSKGSVAYPAGGRVTIPTSCWNTYGYSGSDYITNVRISQVQPKIFGSGTFVKNFNVFELSGLGCLGRETGNAGSWLGAFDKDCEKKSSSGNPMEYLVLYAKNF